MEKRNLSGIGREVSLLGFGCMRLPKLNEDSLAIDWQRAEEMVDYAMKKGVNYYDTAWIYHNGESESFIGSALSKYNRDDYMLADKMPIWLIKSEEDIERIFNEQLKKCKVEYFDFYLLHALDAKSWGKAQKYNVYEKLLEYKKQGKIHRLGFSFHDGADVLEEIAAARAWDFAQIQLNYLDWEDIDSKRQYEVLEKYNIPTVIMEPLRGGALCNLPSPAQALVEKTGMSAAALALRFAMSLGNVLTVLSGMSEMCHVEDNINTVTNFEKMNEAELELVGKVAKLYRTSGSIPCTGCKYCIDCPQGVNIPSIFSIYNNYTVTNNAINFAYCYKSLKETERGNNCIECGQCEIACPQHIEIISSLKEIHEKISALKPR